MSACARAWSASKMTQEERRLWLIEQLLAARADGGDIALPTDAAAQKRLLRSLFNLRPPRDADAAFLREQDAYLQAAIAEKGITDADDLVPMRAGLYLWQGDITTLRCDAIVNAANSALLGCFCPCHGCVDNAIHTYAGVELRLACDRLMRAQGRAEATGTAKVTDAFNLPAKYVIHTVGPTVRGRLTARDCAALASCYRACLAAADGVGAREIAFCCISTGEFGFPNAAAAEIAVRTVQDYRAETKSEIKVIFNVFKDTDREIYARLLGN